MITPAVEENPSISAVSTPQGRPHLAVLDGVRGLAILIVLIHHFRNFNTRKTLLVFPLCYGILFVVFVVFPAVLWLLGRLESSLGSTVVGLAVHITLGISLTFFVSVISYHLFEARFLRLKRLFVSI